MPSIVKKIKKGKPYYYAVESARVDGKPRIVNQVYLGSPERIMKNAQTSEPPKPKEAVIYQYGGVETLWRITQQLGLIDIINRHAPKRNQGPSIGHYMILAAINRALKPKSKVLIGQWYQQTTLLKRWKYSPSVFTSQRFWDHMDELNENQLTSIERDITRRVVESYDINLECLLYDTTNFFSWIDSFNDRPSLPQRGKSKVGRNNLRQVSLALLVSRAERIPLFHDVYPGNRNDFSQFQTIASRLADLCRELKKNCPNITFVFDKGNNSQKGMDTAHVERLHFVGSLTPSHYKDLLDIPIDRFTKCGEWSGLIAYRTTADVFEQKQTVVVTYSERFFVQQHATISRELSKAVQALNALAERLSRWRQGKMKKGRKPTIQSVLKQVADILSAQHMKAIIQTEVHEKDGCPAIDFRTDHQALQSIADRTLGKTILFTDRDDWSTEEIIYAYRGLSKIEDAFKNMKNIEFLHWQPMFHWTDQKIRVHAFYCVLALTLVSLLRLELNRAGLVMTIPVILQQLQDIYEIAVIYPDRKPKITMSRMNKEQKRILEVMGLFPRQASVG
jgi:transposase